MKRLRFFDALLTNATFFYSKFYLFCFRFVFVGNKMAEPEIFSSFYLVTDCENVVYYIEVIGYLNRIEFRIRRVVNYNGFI